jgi:hypothetical protein
VFDCEGWCLTQPGGNTPTTKETLLDIGAEIFSLPRGAK